VDKFTIGFTFQNAEPVNRVVVPLNFLEIASGEHGLPSTLEVTGCRSAKAAEGTCKRSLQGVRLTYGLGLGVIGVSRQLEPKPTS